MLLFVVAKKRDDLVFRPCFVMLLFVYAHKVRWFSVLTLFCDVFVCCCPQSAMVLCYDIVL